MVQVIIMTSDNQQAKVLPAFFHQWQKYFNNLSHSRIVCGFAPFECDANFHSIGKFEDYPANKWSNALIKVLDNVADEIFILMLDDYWLIRQTDMIAIKMIYDYMHQFENVIRFDLTSDRLYVDAGGKYVYGYNTYETLGHLDIIKSDFNSPYHLSLWGGMWRKRLLRKVLMPDETAQQIELNGTHRLSQFGDEMLVLGTRQCPLKHGNVIQRGVWNQDGTTGLPSLKESDRKELTELGYIA